jgi:hypothetical protein
MHARSYRRQQRYSTAHGGGAAVIYDHLSRSLPDPSQSAEGR